MDRETTEPEGEAVPEDAPSTEEVDDDSKPIVLPNSLEDLRRRIAGGGEGQRRRIVPVTHLKVLPSIFQPRMPELVEAHVNDLKKVLKDGKVFDPLLVLQVGPDIIVIDGHHRLEAARRSGRDQKVPVVYFDGTLEEAVVEAGRANHKTTLNMTSQERQDFAWRLVCHGLETFKVGQIVDAAGVSRRQVQIMRKAYRTFIEAKPDPVDPAKFKSWWEAHRAFNGVSMEPMGDDEMEERLRANVARRVESLRGAWGNRMQQNPELSARVLAEYYGERLDSVFRSAVELGLAEDPMEWGNYENLDAPDDF